MSRGLYYNLLPDGSVEQANGRGDNMVGRVVVKHETAGERVSTVFLGIDHNHSNSGPPILFETMVFGGELDGHQVRYAEIREALAYHHNTVRLLWPNGLGTDFRTEYGPEAAALLEREPWLKSSATGQQPAATEADVERLGQELSRLAGRQR